MPMPIPASSHPSTSPSHHVVGALPALPIPIPILFLALSNAPLSLSLASPSASAPAARTMLGAPFPHSVDSIRPWSMANPPVSKSWSPVCPARAQPQLPRMNRTLPLQSPSPSQGLLSPSPPRCSGPDKADSNPLHHGPPMSMSGRSHRRPADVDSRIRASAPQELLVTDSPSSESPVHAVVEAKDGLKHAGIQPKTVLPYDAEATMESTTGKLHSHSLSQSRTRISTLRTKVLTERQLVREQQRRRAQYHEHVTNIQVELADMLTQMVSGSVDGKTQLKLGSLLGQMKEATSILRAHEDEEARLENRLGSLNRRLDKAEQVFSSLLDDWVRVATSSGNGQMEIMSALSSVYSIESGSNSGSSEVPSLLARYYDRAGDITIYQERLAELDWDHQLENVERDGTSAQGFTLVPSELEFIDAYNEKRARIIAEFDKALSEARELETACRKAGLNPEQRSGASSPVLSTTVSKRAKPLPEQSRYYLFSEGRGSGFVEVPLPVGTVGVKHRINNWVSDILKHTDPDLLKQQEQVWHSPENTYSLAIHSVPQRTPSSINPVSKIPSANSSQRLSWYDELDTAWPGEIPERRYSDPGDISQSSPSPLRTAPDLG